MRDIRPVQPAQTMRDMAAQQSEGGNGQVIFEGRVDKQHMIGGTIGAPSNATSMTANGAHRVVELSVSRWYRGEARGQVTIMTGAGQGDCGFDFDTGNEYLVYAEIIEPGVLFTSICTQTAPVELAGAALRYLRREPPSPDDLLDPQLYFQKHWLQLTAKICGRVMKPDGNPLGKANVEMFQVRDEGLPPKTASDPNLSKPDGTFCVEDISPGKYLLTAENQDYDAGNRWMGYFPGVTKHSEATLIEVMAGATLANLQFQVQKQPLYTVRFRLVTWDGSAVPWKELRVAVESPESDALAYREDDGVDEDGSCTLGLIPPGHYLVSSFVQPKFDTQQASAEVSKWRMAKQEVDISGDGEVVLRLVPAPR